MSLISVPLVLCAAVLTAGSAVLAAVLLGRSGGRLPRLRATLAVVLTSVLMLGSLALSGNERMGWFKTTGDLWHAVAGDGGVAQSGTVDVLPPPGGDGERDAAEDVHGALPARLAAHPGDPTWQADFERDEKEDAWRAEVTGPASGLQRSVTVWTPPDYSQTSQTTYDVVLFIHGFPGSDSGVVKSLGVSSTLTSLADAQLIHPTLFVVADLSMGGDAPDCVDVQGRPAVETFLTQDLVQSIRTNFPNVSGQRSGWAISGISAGAYCAPVLYMRHQDQFWGALSMSGYDTPELGSLSQADARLRATLDVSAMVADHDRPPARMWLSGTDNDADSMALLNGVTQSSMPGDDIVTYVDPTGGHSWVTWANQFPHAMKWWGRSVATGGDSTSAASQSGGAQSGGAQSGGGEESRVKPAHSAFVDWLGVTFSLAGWGTLVVSLAGLVLVVWALVHLGPRTAWGGRGRIAGFVLRLAAVGAVAGLACLCVLIVINRPTGFFSSWSDLFSNWGMFI